MDRKDHFLERGADLGGTGVSRDLEAVRKAAVGVFGGVVPLAVQIECAVACDGQASGKSAFALY